jgi:hypothetical protein
MFRMSVHRSLLLEGVEQEKNATNWARFL